VYRARYTKNGKKMALKVIGLGLVGNESSLARFEREANILKQLNHPNIVRFYGAGRSQGTPYYAMEYIEGESLDHVMSRRGRLTWEEVIQLGSQLCDALQHAHEKGIIHRDLKPSNLMVLPDGTIKLTDFGIAKDTDVTALTAANCTVGTAAYMSPEQCRGDRDLTFKSDLYSLGVLFYELLTGRKPFIAETPMDMFLLHLQAQCERPSRLVLNTPVWLDNLICQLLEKKPDQRPRDAEMVKRALEEVVEKVEAQQSAGVDAVRGRRDDRPRGDKPGEEDREAARTLKQGGSKKKGKKKVKPFYEKIWFQAVGIVLLLALLAGVLYWVFQPPSADSIYRQAQKLMESKDPEDHQTANDSGGPLAQYLKYYGKRDDDQARQVRAWVDQAGREYSEKILDLLVRSQKGKMGLKRTADTPVEKSALKAALKEEEGEDEKAVAAWQEVKEAAKEPADRPWGLLAAEKLEDLAMVDDYARRLAKRIEAVQKTKEEYKPQNELEKGLAHDAIQAEIAGEVAKAREAWESVKKQLEADVERTKWPLTEVERRRWIKLANRKVFELTRADNPPPK
jgi:serine/threonine-protein kinase